MKCIIFRKKNAGTFPFRFLPRVSWVSSGLYIYIYVFIIKNDLAFYFIWKMLSRGRMFIAFRNVSSVNFTVTASKTVKLGPWLSKLHFKIFLQSCIITRSAVRNKFNLKIITYKYSKNLKKSTYYDRVKCRGTFKTIPSKIRLMYITYVFDSLKQI